MKSSSWIPLALVAWSSASLLIDRAVPNNNCGRAVAGTANGAASLSKAKMDCSSNVISYMTVTVTPTALTSTSIIRAVSTTSPITIVTSTGSTTRTITTVAVQTITSFSTTTSSTTTTVAAPNRRDLEQRAATGTIPKYASACTNYAEYVSACAVAGVTQSTSTVTTTAAAPTSTVTSYTTSILTNFQTVFTESDLSFTQTKTISTTTTVNQVTTVVATATAAACVPPAGNILGDPGFNDGSFDGPTWNPGGTGAFTNSIVTDAQCGPYGAQFSVSSSLSYGRIGQKFDNVLDSTKQYQIQTYAKLVSGNPTNCIYYVTCGNPDDHSFAGSVIKGIPVRNLMSDWTKYLVNCPSSARSLDMTIVLQCDTGTGPVTIGVDETAMYPIN